jgi:hypothetical protein
MAVLRASSGGTAAARAASRTLLAQQIVASATRLKPCLEALTHICHMYFLTFPWSLHE